MKTKHFGNIKIQGISGLYVYTVAHFSRSKPVMRGLVILSNSPNEAWRISEVRLGDKFKRFEGKPS